MIASETLYPAGEASVLVLQGGGALGSYQAGIYEALAGHQTAIDWVAGISIGAINAALIVGNPAERRVARLREFWELVSSDLTAKPFIPGEQARTAFNELSAAWIATFGVPGFFTPRVPPATFYPAGAPEALSLYETGALKGTLERLVDFDRINRGEVRLSVGAVNVRSGNFIYFDNRTDRIGPEHIMASGALPPGFPPVIIDGEAYWDGGLVSNTPLDYVLDTERQRDLVVYQVDLFSAQGPMPRTLVEAAEREKDIRYSSRTRLNTDKNIEIRRAKRAMRRLIERLPPEMQADDDVGFLRQVTRQNFITMMQLIYRQKRYEANSKDYEFSRATMLEHWQAGRDDAVRSLRHRRWRERAHNADGVAVFDLSRHARD
ncbi:patatin-like phospholipase family protein [Methylobacterium sp. E-005]|uniref:patatin-like phospholipase family protein n=1 Tax=Methylobacterium sp. E-005 TaxID=2836549 RepID=UPI001FBA7915|nr:patatin-like phospholipase family protein [Methylobacterium sp. E-005]MCJ2090803.1 patatin-like phospholipase family protein [Methylobacterium sp. E-005]